MRNMINNIDACVHNIIDKYLFEIGVVILLAISFLIRWHLAPITMLSADYNDFLVPWTNVYVEEGLKGGLAQAFGSYYVPYNLFLGIISYLPLEPWVMIALFSCTCDYAIGIFVYKISVCILKEKNCNDREIYRKSVIAGVVSVLLPATLMNGALWKQCDAVYTSFMIISLYYALKEKNNKSLLFLGISFAFKLQGIFILPFYVLLYIIRKKGLSFIHFAWIPGMYLIGGLPAIIAGRRVLDTYDCYLHQATYSGFDAMNILYPNIYTFGLTDYPALCLPAIMITLGIFILMALFVIQNKNNLTQQNLLLLATWCLWACVMFLPAIHERYNYPVLILLTVVYLLTDLKKIWTAIVLNLISCVQYGICLFHVRALEDSTMAIWHTIIFLYVTYDLINKLKIDDRGVLENEQKFF